MEILDKEGAIQPATLYDMRGQFASDQLAIVTNQNALSSSILNLSQLMNVPYDKDMQLERSEFENMQKELAVYETSSGGIYDEAVKNLAIIKATELRQRGATTATKVAAANFYPTVSLQTQFGTNFSSAASRLTPAGTSDIQTNNFVQYNGSKLPVFSPTTSYTSDKIGYFNQFGNNLNGFIGVNVSIPIFNAFQSRTQVSLAKIQEKNADVIAQYVKLQLKQAIEQAYLNMNSTYERYKILTQQVQAFQSSFNVADKKLTEGVIHSVDYLIVKNNLDRANANLINARYDYLLRLKVLDFYRGK